MRFLILGAVLASLTLPARADTRVALELVLLADATGSIDAAEIRFQREGYAKAITHPDVLDAISFTGPIAVTYVEWANVGSQDVVVDWTLIEDAESCASRSPTPWSPLRARRMVAMPSALRSCSASA